MKFCHRAYEHLYIGDKGITRPCSWVDAKILNLGSLLEKDLEEIWNSTQAKMFRDSIADGSFKYCIKMSCPFLSNDSLPELTTEEFEKEVKSRLNRYPSEFNLAYDSICNHACPVCRSSIFVPDRVYPDQINTIGSKILPHLKEAKIIMASGRGDLFASPLMLDLMARVHPADPRCSITLETNGVLLKKHWHKVKHLEKNHLMLTVTANSFNRYTYKSLSGNRDDLAEMQKSLHYARYLRQKERLKELRITMVVQDSNFREIPDFISRSLNTFKADKVILRPVLQWFGISRQDYWFKNVLNPLHPYHQEYLDVMTDPICAHPRVYHWNGDNRSRKAVSLQELLNTK